MQVLLASCLCDHSTVPNPWRIPENIKICRSQKLRISWTGVTEFSSSVRTFSICHKNNKDCWKVWRYEKIRTQKIVANFKLLYKPSNTRFNLRNVPSDAQGILAQVSKYKLKGSLKQTFLKQAFLTWGWQCSLLDLCLDNCQLLKLHDVQILRCSAAECDRSSLLKSSAYFPVAILDNCWLLGLETE